MRAWSLWASSARLGEQREAEMRLEEDEEEQKERDFIYREIYAHAHASGLSGIYPRSQISIMSAAMRRYMLLFPSPFILSFSICRFAFALPPLSSPLPSFSLLRRDERNSVSRERSGILITIARNHQLRSPRPIERGYPRR